jgi:hypothetical protein
MTKLLRLAALTAAIVVCLGAAPVFGQEKETFSAKLSGFKEVGNTGPTNSPGSGTFQLKVTDSSMTYTLTYSALSTPVTQAHVHFGEPGVSAGVMFFLCTNLGNGPAGTPACPADGGTVTGTITAASIVGPAGQNVSPGDFAAALKIIRAGVGYANVHTMKFPVGEIRGQLARAEGEDD